MSNDISEDEKRQTKKALSGNLRYFDASVFQGDNLRKLEDIAERQGKTELREILLEEELRRN